VFFALNSSPSLPNLKWEVIADAEGRVAESYLWFSGHARWNFPICLDCRGIIGVPIAVLSALYLTFYARGAVKKFLVSLIDLISSISIITLWFLGLHCFDEQWGILGKTSQ
jgi:hypothetical protein